MHRNSTDQMPTRRQVSVHPHCDEEYEQGVMRPPVRNQGSEDDHEDDHGLTLYLSEPVTSRYT